jgi:hypothetical protein
LTDLLLKRAATSQSGGEWNEDDYDVLADGDVVGRIYKANAAPVSNALDVDTSLRAPPRSNSDTRLPQRARPPMAAFAKSWRRGMRPSVQ